jgi:cytochrome P450
MTTFPTLSGAWPIVGHLPEMYRGFPELCRRGTLAHGPLFYIHGGPGARQLMCTHAQALALLRRKEMTNGFYAEGFGALLHRTLLAFDGEEHRHIRSVLSPAFTPKHLHGSDVLPTIVDVVERAIDAWIDRGSVEILTGTQAIALEIIFRIIGAEAADLPQWQRQYRRYLLAGLPSRGRVRGPVYLVASRAREWLDACLCEIVERERERGQTDTLIGTISNARDEAGDLLAAKLVVANLRLLVLAGHETTASAMAWSAVHLAESSLQARGTAEARDVDDPIAAATADTPLFAEKMFRESLRIYPPNHSAIRRTTGDVTLDDLPTIPGGTLVNIPFVHLLRNEREFPEPTRFLPDRWRERPKPGSLGTVMFAGGPHFCLGYHLAIPEGTLFTLLLARALARRRVVMRRAGALPSPIWFPLGHPPRNLRLSFEKES